MPAEAQVIDSDTYGHTLEEYSPTGFDPSYQWIDILGTGTKVIHGGTDVSSNAPAPTGIGGPVELGHPFTFYGTTYTSLVPTSNGYLSTDPDESGADKTTYCTLPAKPSAGGGGRIYVHQRDWTFTAGPDAGVYYQYFPKSPHSHAICGVSVFTWEGMLPASGGGGIATHFQVLLFDHGDIIMNVQNVTQFFSTTTTVGLLSPDASDGVGLDCSDPLGSDLENHLLFRTPEVLVIGGSDYFGGDTAADVQAAIDAVQAAIDSVPPGGKLLFRKPFSDYQAYGHTFTLDKPMTLMGVLQNFIPGDLDDRIDTRIQTQGLGFVVNGAQVNVIGARMIGAAGPTFTVGGGGGLTLCESAILNSGSYGIVLDGGGSLFLNRTSMESSRLDGRDHVLGLAGSRVRLYRSVLIGSPGAGIRLENDTASETGYDLDVISSSIVRSGGPGIFGDNIRARIVNSTISNNLDEGIHLENSELVLRHSTVADQKGPGLWLGRSDATLSHTLFSGNRNPATGALVAPVAVSSSTMVSEGFNLFDTGFPGSPLSSDQTNKDAKITPLGTYGTNPVGGGTATFYFGHPMMAHLLLNGSPAIDVGGSQSDLPPGEKDIRGVSRAMNGSPGGGLATLDAGAVEARPPVVVTTAADQLDSPAGAQVSLREALRDGSRVLFAPGLNGQVLDLSTGGGGLGGTLNTIGGGKFVDASNLPDGLTISGGEEMTVALSQPFDGHGLTFEGGRGSAFRGQWYSCFSNCTFRDNQYANPGSVQADEHLKDGGAIFSDFHATFTNCRFEDNHAGKSGSTVDGEASGGAIAIGSRQHVGGSGSRRYGGLYLVNCVFENNHADTGALGVGAVYTRFSQRVIIDGCTFSENRGGAIGAASLGSFPDSSLKIPPPVKVTRSAFIDNINSPQYYLRPGSDNPIVSSRFTGGLSAGGLGVQVSHCTFQGNQAGTSIAFDFLHTVSAGALAINGDGHIYRCTIVGNLIGPILGTGGAGASIGGGIEVSRSIFDSNWNGSNGASSDYHPIAVVGAGSAVSTGYNLTSSGSAFFNHPTDLSGVPVRLSPLHWPPDAPPVLHPRHDSPAIDGGGGAVLSRFDQRGVPVSQGSAPDIGAVETLPPTVVTTGNDESGGPGGSGLSLREALDIAPKGGFITFDPANFFNPVTVLNSSLETNRDVFIDAGMVPGFLVLADYSGRCLRLTDTPHAVSIIGVSFAEGSMLGKAGGGILIETDAALSLSQSAIYQNYSDEAGGGIHVENGTLRAQNVTFAQNVGSSGAAISTDGHSEVSLDYVTVRGNTGNASTASAVVIGSDSTLSVRGSVFSDNVNGPGRPNVSVPAGSLDERNFNLGIHDSEPYSVSHLQSGNGQAPICPPLPGSPIVDAGGLPVYGGAPREDARGFARPYGFTADIGAMELGAMRPDGGPGVDLDGDGMDDFWEIFHGLEVGPNDSASNFDGDDFTALEEYQNATNPNVPDSFGPLSVIDFSEMPAGGWELLLEVPQGGMHELQVSDDLVNWEHVKLFFPTLNPATVTSLPGEHPADEPTLFFRVEKK